MSVTIISKKEFIEKLSDVDTNPTGWDGKHKRPVLVDFFATWCGPCKALSPILQEVSEEYQGKIDIYKVDVDEDQELTALFNVRTVPTLLFAKPTDSKPTLMLGVMGKAELKSHIESLLL